MSNILRSAGVIALALCTVMSAGCRQGGGGAGRTEVKECSTYNNDEAACDNARQAKGEKCIFDSGKCVVAKLGGPAPAGKCADYNGQKDECGKKIECEYDAAASTCKDAADPRNCANVKDETLCKTTYGAASSYTCAWVSGACQKIASSSVVTYTLTKLDRLTEHNITSQYIRGLTAAGNGSYVYLIGSGAAVLKSKASAAGPGLWDDAAGLGWGNILDAADHNANMGDLSDYSVGGYFPYETGLIFNLVIPVHGVAVGNGLVVLNGSGPTMTSAYKQVTASGLAKDAQLVPFFVTKGGNSYIYAFNQTTAKNGVSWRQYTAPDGTAASDDTYATGGKSGARNDGWNNSLKKSDVADLDVTFTAAAYRPGGGVYLGHKGGVKILAEADIAQNSRVLAFNGGDQFTPDGNLKIGGVDNDGGVTAMAAWDSMVLIGMNANGHAEKGGLIVYDSNGPDFYKFGNGLGITVNGIAVARHGKDAGEYAVVSTDKGIWIMDKATHSLREPVAGEGSLIDMAYIRSNKAVDNDPAQAVSGFKGYRPPAGAPNNVVGAGQMASGLWYFAIKGGGDDDGGVFTLDIADTPIKP